MTVSLLEVLGAARAHAAPLAAESAGYLLLAVADSVAVSPRSILADDVELGQDGTVRLRAQRGPATSAEAAERGVRSLLRSALTVSSSVGPALRRAAERREDVGLTSLVRELETALIPVNRSAAKRALSRLHRETERARDAGRLKIVEEALSAEAVVPVSVPVAAPLPQVEPRALAVPAPVVEVSAESVELPAVMALPTPPPAPVRRPEPPELTLTPEPHIAKADQVFTKPEPVVLRARERGARTPRLGTVVTAQTLAGEEQELTERAPSVVEDDELSIDVVVELEEAAVEQPLVDPEPSCMPDVLTAMRALHTGVDPDDAPTRLRDVVTAPRVLEVTPDVVTSAPELFISELADPALHEAVTWAPAPVAPRAELAPIAAAVLAPEEPLEESPLAPSLFLVEPPLELSPYAPAVLPARRSDVSELLDSFHVSGAAEERDLRSALKEMAGLELTPMPHPLVEKA